MSPSFARPTAEETRKVTAVHEVTPLGSMEQLFLGFLKVSWSLQALFSPAFSHGFLNEFLLLVRCLRCRLGIPSLQLVMRVFLGLAELEVSAHGL
jgi:hypothetical protein